MHLFLDAHAAMQELETALLDVRMVEKRRKIADAQLELAREGLLGIDYDKRPNASAVSGMVVGDDTGY